MPSLSDKKKKETVLITGSNCAVGQHLIKHLQLYKNELIEEIRTMDTDKPFQKLMDYDSSIPVHCVQEDLFGDTLEDLVKNVDTVFHMMEHQDYGILPDEDEIVTINVLGTKRLISICETAGVKRIIYFSSVLVMANRWWPSAVNPEMSDLPPANSRLFPAYCDSKLQAEQAVKSSSMQSFVVRLTGVYGEGDQESPIFDALRLAHNRQGILPLFGDRSNAFQFAYAGNVAWGVLKILEQMHSDRDSSKETVFLVDDTPVLDIYSLLEPFLEARGMRLSKCKVPFFPLFIPYLCFEKCVSFVNAFIVNVKPYVSHLPTPMYFHTYFYFWYFFSGLKARTYLGYKPLYSHEKSMLNSASYYATCELDR